MPGVPLTSKGNDMLKGFLTSLLLIFSTQAFADCATPQVCYSPNGGCSKMIVGFIDGARKGSQLRMSAYNFTASAIGDAIVRAQKRGVDVGVIEDGKAALQKGEQIDKVATSGAAVFIDHKHAIAHNKVIIIDDDILTGSYNYSNNAELHNAENAIILVGYHQLAQEYIANWGLHKAHSVPFRRK